MYSLLKQLAEQTPYHSYLYSYPHKTAYRPLTTPVELAPVWSKEDRSALFLYIHVPFCTMRCGFCNLFTLAQPRGDIAQRYVQQLVNQMHITAEVLGEHQFGAFACGGGTPTFLQADQLDLVFSTAHDVLGLDLHKISGCIEVSPDTVTDDRLQVCKNIGMERISMGLQSFYHAEVQALARHQDWKSVDNAITRIRQHDFPVLNLDLIYGIPGQTVQSFMESLQATLRYAPEELYLYPLYVRPLTGLNKIKTNALKRQTPKSIELVQEHQKSLDLRLEMYIAARCYLLSEGYEQVSMRMFKKKNLACTRTPNVHYSCQNDGMVGIGCGARSYTRELHYSEEYGIAQARISDILRAYVERNPQDFRTARYGFQLNRKEQQHRFVIQSLLVYPGLLLVDYEKRFNSSVMKDLPKLQELLDLELATLEHGTLTLNAKGMSYADTIGPWLITEEVHSLMQAYELT